MMDFAAMLREERKRARQQQASAKPPAVVISPGQRPILDERDCLKAAPPCVWRLDDFVSPEEEAALLEHASSSPAGQWTQLSGRRLQSLGGLPRPEQAMLPVPMPSWAASVCDALVRAGVFPEDEPPNHILLNEYGAGQGLGAHMDGPLYAPRVAILSLASSAHLDFLAPGAPRDADDAAFRVPMPRRSVLVFSGAAYDELQHRVPAVRERRISMTVRRVLHVLPEDGAPHTPLPLWEERMCLARWLDDRPSQQERCSLSTGPLG